MTHETRDGETQTGGTTLPGDVRIEASGVATIAHSNRGKSIGFTFLGLAVGVRPAGARPSMKDFSSCPR